MNRLRPVLRLNAASCLLFGLLFIAVPSPVAAFLADRNPAPEWLIMGLGIGLLLNGLGLFITARAPLPNRIMVRFFSIGDALWVLGTLVLLASGIWIDRVPGGVAALAVAAFVGAAGWMQWAAVSGSKGIAEI